MEFSQPLFLYSCNILDSTGWYAGCTRTNTKTYNISTKDFKTFEVESYLTELQEYYFSQKIIVSQKTNMTLDINTLPSIVDEESIIETLTKAWNNLQQRFRKYQYLSTIVPKDLLPLLLI